MTHGTASRWTVFLCVLAATLLHIYICFIAANGGLSVFSVGLFVCSMLPFLACVVAIRTASVRWQVVAACAVVPMLLISLRAFYDVFIAPTSSTAPLVLLVAPVVNLAVLVLGFLAGWVMFKARDRVKAGRAR